MLEKKAFTISIGEYGVIVALHQGKNILNKILLASLTDENKPQLENLFTKNSSTPIYILLDTVEQNYKRKSYPPVTGGDFSKIVQRDLKKEFAHSEKTLQNYLGTKDKVSKKWECTFISVTCSAEVEKWIDFLITMPNKPGGIYMLPIEGKIFANAVFNLAKTSTHVRSNNSILSLIVQNKISGIRQIVFSNQSIVFTRVVNYNFDDPQFAYQFEQDIFRANEYLKMIFPQLKAQDVVGINILSDDLIKKISTSQSHDLHFINYSPNEIAEKFGLINATSKNNSNFSDVIIANFFVNNQKKVLKFSKPKVVFLEKLYLTINSAFALNIIVTILIVVSLLKALVTNHFNDKQILSITKEKTILEQQIQTINNAALDGEDSQKNSTLANEIIDFGKIDELLTKNTVNIAEVFSKLSVLKNYKSIASSFSFYIPGYDPKSETPYNHFSIAISGEVFEPGGDVENLLRNFDTLNLGIAKQFSDYNVKFSEVPAGIDFSKKYYSFPFSTTIESKPK